MHELPAGRMLALSGALFVLLLIAAGCNTVAPLTRDESKSASLANAPTIQPGMELEWACQSASNERGSVRVGKAVVGPDGTCVLGPYGNCAIAGLTLDQASTKIEKHLSSYFKQPRVTLSAVQKGVTTSAIVWQKAEPGDPMARLASKQEIHPVSGTQPQPLPKEKPAAPTPTLTLPINEDWPGPHPVPPHAVAVMPPPGRHGGKHRGPPLPLPTGPNEMNPVLLPEYVIRPPDVLVIETMKGLQTETPKGAAPLQPIRGPHLVRPDGTVSIGIYGPAKVAGETVDGARRAIAKVIFSRLDQTKPALEKEIYENLSVDVLAYNSSVFYVITDGAGLGAQVFRFPITGNETVLDAISMISGLPAVSSPQRIWVARRNPGHGPTDCIYPVDWKGIVMHGTTTTNWQLMPGDRVFVQADPVRRFNNNLQKFLEPVERVMGAVLLGSQTTNSIRSGAVTNR